MYKKIEYFLNQYFSTQKLKGLKYFWKKMHLEQSQTTLF